MARENESGTRQAPGAWDVEDYGAEVYLDGIQAQFSVQAGDFDTVAYAFTAERARLIAAAPDLLAALELIVSWNRDHANDQYGDPDAAESWACVRAARAAISKATGEPQ